MQGTWLLVSAEENGNKVADDAVHANLVIKGDKLLVYVGAKIMVEGTLTIDPTKKPKTMDTVVVQDKNVKLRVPPSMNWMATASRFASASTRSTDKVYRQVWL